MDDQFTPEQKAKIAEYEANMLKFYEARLPFIRIQHEYETKNAEIIESRARIIRANDFVMQYELGKEQAKKDAEKAATEKTDGINKD